METYTLSDQTIGQVAKLIQVAILTGTDIIDNLRDMELTIGEDGNLVLSPDYSEKFSTNVETMVKEAANIQEAAGISLKSIE
tara:strand:+ start:1680 stop:1925 length:246 start_codon:yes stop_codon:yes gene_type:complete